MGGFGSFAGGLSGGLSGGVDIADKLRQLQEAARIRAARRAMGNAYLAPEDPMGGAPLPPAAAGPQPPMPGQSSMPSPDPMMGLPTGGAPMPPGAAPPMPAPGPAPMAAPPPAAPMPAPISSPVAARAGAGGDPLTAQPGAEQQGTSTIQDANETIRSIAAQVKKANPGIDPETLFEATRQHIENMKGVRNEVKDYMVQQTEYAKVQARLEAAAIRAASSTQVAETNARARTDSATIGAGSREKVAETNAGARVESAGIGADSRVRVGAGHDAAARDTAGTRADAARAVSKDRLKGTVYNATSRDTTAADTARVGAQGRVDAAAAGMGKTPTDRYSARTPKAAPAYRSSADVQKAYRDGKIDYNTAAAILKKNKWAQ